jgi:hypothetical protein
MITVTPTAMMIGAIGFGVVMVVISVGVSLMITSGVRANSTQAGPNAPGTRLASAEKPNASPLKNERAALPAHATTAGPAKPVAKPPPAPRREVASYAEATQPIEKPVADLVSRSAPPAAKAQSRNLPSPMTEPVSTPGVAPTPAKETAEPAKAVAPAPVQPPVSAPAPPAVPEPALPAAASIDKPAHPEVVVAEQAVSAPPPPATAPPPERPSPNVVAKPAPSKTTTPGPAMKPPERTRVAEVADPPAMDPAPPPSASDEGSEESIPSDIGDLPRKPSGDINFNALPMLSESERLRLGLPKLKINLVGLPSKRQPHPSALINLNKVYVGEIIPNTDAKLIGVDLHGIAIQVNGRDYFLPK